MRGTPAPGTAERRVLGVLTAVWAVVTVLLLGGSRLMAPQRVGPLVLLYTLVAVVAAVRAARSPRAEARTRVAWRCVAGGFGCLLASDVCFAAGGSYPGPGDALRLVAVAPLLTGLLRMQPRPRSGEEHKRLALDIALVVAGGAMALWYFSLGPMVVGHRASGAVLAASTAYVLADLLVLFGAATALLRGGGGTGRRTLALFLLGLGFLAAADLARGAGHVAVVQGPGQGTAGGAEWLAVVTGFWLLACAAVEQCRSAHSAPGRERETGASPVTLLPYVAVASGFGLLLLAALRQGVYPWVGLVLGAVVMNGLVVYRQVLALRENHRLLVTDHLTGLTTRTELRAELVTALEAAGRTGRPAAVLLLDLDRFKRINDEYGHEAGDEALVAFAGVLRRRTADLGTAGRLGGDEFAVVLPGVADVEAARAVAEAVLADLRQPFVVADRLTRLGTSIGVALSQPHEDARQLLHRADLAMYEAKRGGRGRVTMSPDAQSPPVSPPVSPAVSPAVSRSISQAAP